MKMIKIICSILLVVLTRTVIAQQGSVYIEINGERKGIKTENENKIGVNKGDKLNFYFETDSSFCEVDTLIIHSVIEGGTMDGQIIEEALFVGDGVKVSEIFKSNVRAIDFTVPKELNCDGDKIRMGSKYKRSFRLQTRSN